MKNRSIIALDGLRLAGAFGVLNVIERDDHGRIVALRSRKEHVTDAAFEQLQHERRITPLQTPVRVDLVDPVAVYFDTANVFHEPLGPAQRSTANNLWKRFFGLSLETLGGHSIDESVPGFVPGSSLPLDHVVLTSPANATAVSARLVKECLAALHQWDAHQHQPLEPNLTWRLLRWLEFALGYTGDARAGLAPSLAAWRLAVAQTGRVQHLAVDRLEALLASRFRPSELRRIRQRADTLRMLRFGEQSKLSAA